VTFNDPTLWTSADGLHMQNNTQILERYIPTQVPFGSGGLGISSSQSQAVVIANFVANLGMSASLNQLWSMINTQQLIVMMPLFKVSMPANAQAFFNQIFTIAAFQIFNLDPYINKMLDLNAT
jgi:hypothetical protein